MMLFRETYENQNTYFLSNEERSTECFCTILHKLFNYASAKMQTYSFDRTDK